MSAVPAPSLWCVGDGPTIGTHLSSTKLERQYIKKDAMSNLILLRHGQSEWNELNLFTGWYDCDLTPAGADEAAAAGPLIDAAGLAPDVIHTSLQTRAIRTAQLCAEAIGRMWVPVRRSWRLNERHYGDLTGRDKAETAARYGEDMV
jgi:2,3-bisphosphoglycerate-dependent phosphoglycerate mutase